MFDIYCLFNKDQRISFIYLQFLVVFMAIFEVLSVMAIGPFMAIVSNSSIIFENTSLKNIYIYFGFYSVRDFIMGFGFFVISLLFVSSAISIITTWRMSVFGSMLGAEFSSRLFKKYMSEEWVFHSRVSSSQLTKKIAQECGRVGGQVIMPILKMNAKLVMGSLMAVTVFLYNSEVAIIGVGILFLSYFFLYKIVKIKLGENGKAISIAQGKRFKLMSDGFGAIKDLILLDRGSYFSNRFETESELLSRSQAVNQVLSQIPRYAIELVAFGSLVFLVIYTAYKNENEFEQVVPILAIYALAGFKLIPAFQQVYSSLAIVRGNVAAFNSIKKDLGDYREENFVADNDVNFKESLSLESVSYRYPEKNACALVDVSVEIAKNEIVAFVGPSGSGKSTLIDIMSGLLVCDKGMLKVDGEVIGYNNLKAWRKKISIVSQSIYLLDGSVKENVAFGVGVDDVDEDKIWKCLELANLKHVVKDLPNDINEKVGDKGVQLSGGQRQRIGIARALYQDSDVLIFDEATSSLDGITERIIMDAIDAMVGKKTIIIIAHRLATVKRANQLYLIEDGRVNDSGSYEYLLRNNKLFMKMANHA